VQEGETVQRSPRIDIPRAERKNIAPTQLNRSGAFQTAQVYNVKAYQSNLDLAMGNLLECTKSDAFDTSQSLQVGDLVELTRLQYLIHVSIG